MQVPFVTALGRTLGELVVNYGEVLGAFVCLLNVSKA